MASAVSVMWGLVKPVFDDINNLGIAVISTAISTLQTTWNAVWNGLHVAVETADSLIEAAISKIVGAINDLIKAYNAIPLLPNIPTIGGGTAAAPSGAQGSAAIGSTSSGVKVHATGGTMAAGEIGVVGDQGPEVWIPNTAGTVIPNLGANGGIQPMFSGSSSSASSAAPQPIYLQVNGQTFATLMLPAFQTAALQAQRGQSLPVFGTTQTG